MATLLGPVADRWDEWLGPRPRTGYPARMLPTLAQYQRHRRWIEVGGWGVLLLVNAVMNSLVVIADLRRAGDPLAAWQPVTWEFTSTLVTAMLIPVIVMFNAWLRPRTGWWQALLAHGLATVPFCLLHVGGMVLLREAVYALVGEDYAFAPWWRELGYEYLKDVRSYFLILALIELYALLLRRWQGEARMLTDDAQQPQPVTDRFLVKKLGREFLVRVQDIDWIEASGNYITLHVGTTEYLLRETMARVERRLAAREFVRVHRSAIINLNRLVEIRVHDSGDGEAQMHNGDHVPVSRRSRSALKSRLNV